MYVLITTRVVKINTGSTEKFAPRTANSTSMHVSGPFGAKSAQRAALAALATHTCLDAQIWSEAKIREAYEHRSSLSYFMAECVRRAVELIDGAKVNVG